MKHRYYPTQALTLVLPFPGETSDGISRDDFIDNVAADILENLPVAFETWRVKKQIQMSLTPTGVVLLQELDRFNLLVTRIKKTLELLRKVSNCHIKKQKCHL